MASDHVDPALVMRGTGENDRAGDPTEVDSEVTGDLSRFDDDGGAPFRDAIRRELGATSGRAEAR